MAIGILVTLMAVSCVQTRSLTIDIPFPASRELPQQIQSLTLVSQAVNDQFDDLTADSLQKIFYNKNFRLDTVLYDYHMADTTLKALGELLFESGRYIYAIPETRFIPPSPILGMANELPGKP